MTLSNNVMQNMMKTAAKAQHRDQNVEHAVSTSKSKLQSGLPIFVTVDEVVDDATIKGHLLVDTFGVKAGQRITLRQAQGHTTVRNSLKTAIAGNEWIAKIVKNDLIGFDRGYVENNMVMVGAVAARVHDKMFGQVQVFTAMTRPSKAVVNKKGALQSGIITDGKSAVAVNSPEGLKTAFAKVKSEKWPGGNPGFIIRDRDGHIADFFETKDMSVENLIEDLQHNGVAPSADNILELIPAWHLPMSKEQISKDVNPRVETGKGVIGEFSRQYMAGSEIGYLPSLVVVALEEEWAFGGKTGKIVPVITSMAPVFQREAVSADRLPSSKRAYGGTPNTVLKLYNEEVLVEMHAGRISRRGYEDPTPEKPSYGNRNDNNSGGGYGHDDDEGERPTPKMSFGRR